MSTSTTLAPTRELEWPATGRPDATDPALVVPPDVRLKVCHEDFERLCRENPDLRLERSADGELIVMAPAGTDSSGLNALLTFHLVAWTVANGTGKAFDSSAGFRLPNGATRGPDASWILKERLNTLSATERRAFAPICPDFVIELQSPSDRRKDVRDKLREYIAQGARLGWLIDPDAGEVEIYRPSRDAEILQRPTTLSGEDVLPGFVLDLKDILPAAPHAESPQPPHQPTPASGGTDG